MAYNCANCGRDQASPRALAEHMTNEHDSPFLEGDERLIALSADAVKKMPDKNRAAKLSEKFADHGRVI